MNKKKNTKNNIRPPILRLIVNDFRLIGRTGAGSSNVFVFVIILAFLFGLFFNSNPQITNVLEITPILYLSTIVIASAMRISSTLVYEREQGIINQFVVAPFSKDILFITKTISNFIFLFIVNIVYFAALTLFINTPVDYLMLNCFLVMSFILIPFSIIGTFVSIVMISAQKNDILFASILIPLEMPILLSAISTLSKLPNNYLFDVLSLLFLTLYTILIFFIGAYISERIMDPYS